MSQLQSVLEMASTPSVAPASAPVVVAAAAINGGPPRLLATVLCEDVAHSAAEDTPLIYRIFLVAVAERLPHPQRLTVVTFWLFDAPGVYEVAVRVLTPDGAQWVNGALEVEIEQPGTYHTTSVNFGVLAFPAHGRYRVEVLVDGELAGAYPLFVQAGG